MFEEENMQYAEIIKCLSPCGLNCVKCEKTNFDPNLKERWIKINNRMKTVGVEAYYEETKDAPRYI
ncbi:MAG: hypothetical protein WC581_11855 [Thermodesulfovibrionales bacterium]